MDNPEHPDPHQELPPPHHDERLLDSPHHQALRPPTWWEKYGIFRIALLVVLVAVTGMGALLSSSVKHNEQVIKSLPTMTPTPPPGAPTPADDMADWKEYTNTKGGYELRLPQDWVLEEESALNVSFINQRGDQLTISETKYVDAKTKLNAEKEFQEVWAKAPSDESSNENEMIKIKNVKIDEHDAFQYISRSLEESTDPFFLLVTLIWRENSNFNIILESEREKMNDPELRKMYDKILSTFKFLDETVSGTPMPQVTGEDDPTPTLWQTGPTKAP